MGVEWYRQNVASFMGRAWRRAPWLRHTKFAFTNFGVSLGLQATDVWPERVERMVTAAKTALDQ